MVVGSIPIAHPSSLGLCDKFSCDSFLFAPVAQRIEHRPPEPRVGGSNPLRRVFTFLYPACIIAAALAFIMLIPARSRASGIEAAAGVWREGLNGNLSFDGSPLDLRHDLGYTKEERLIGRLKVHLPGWLPNMYFMATFAKFSSENTLPHPFVSGGLYFSGGVPFESHTQLNHYDIAGFYSLVPPPSRKKFNVDGGLDLRVISFNSSITQNRTTFFTSSTIVVPLLYLGARFRPFPLAGLEAEARGMDFGSEYYVDLIGRIKVFPVKPAFIAAGYRYDRMKIDRPDIRTDASFTGPFVEAGLEL